MECNANYRFCVKCVSGYGVRSRACYSCNHDNCNNCSQYNYNLCTSCVTGFTLSDNDTCVGCTDINCA